MSDSPARSPLLLLALGFMAGVLTSVGGYVGWEVLKPGPVRPTPAPTAPPSTEAALATPAPSPSVAEATPAEAPPTTERAASPPPPAPTPAPKPLVGKMKVPERKPVPDLSVQAGELADQGNGAASTGNYEQALVYFDEALKLDPGNAKAKAGKATAQAAATALRRSFVFDLTAAENIKGQPGRLAGFDTDGVEVKRAAQVPGRIEFEVAPARVKPGDRFLVRVFLRNTGKKDIKIKEMNVSRAINGIRNAMSPTIRAKEVNPQARALLDELPGVWASDTSAWVLDVVVVSNRGDNYQNQLVWK